MVEDGWLKCTLRGEDVAFLWNRSAFRRRPARVELFSGLYYFPDAHANLVVTISIYALHEVYQPRIYVPLPLRKYLRSVYFRKQMHILLYHQRNLCSMSKESPDRYPTFPLHSHFLGLSLDLSLRLFFFLFFSLLFSRFFIVVYLFVRKLFLLTLLMLAAVVSLSHLSFFEFLNCRIHAMLNIGESFSFFFSWHIKSPYIILRV